AAKAELGRIAAAATAPGAVLVRKTRRCCAPKPLRMRPIMSSPIVAPVYPAPVGCSWAGDCSLPAGIEKPQGGLYVCDLTRASLFTARRVDHRRTALQPCWNVRRL